MFKRRKIVATLATCALIALGVGAVRISADAEQSLSGFEISSVSVRVNATTDQNGKDTSGIRFKTDVGANAKETYKNAVCYTTVTIDDKDCSRDVAAQVWRVENDGWNTIVMGIPQSDYATKITAQSFIKVNESTMYATKAVSYSISDAAELVVQDQNASAETKAAVEKYIWSEETYSYTFADYTAGVQYGYEEHVLDENITITTNKCYFTKQLRLYSSGTNNSNAILSTKQGVFGAFTMKAGENADTLNIYGSTDGVNWTLIQGVSIISTYKEYSVDIDEAKGYTYLKLDVAGTKQIRLTNIGVTLCGYGLNYDGSTDGDDSGNDGSGDDSGNESGGDQGGNSGGNESGGSSGGGTTSGTGAHNVGTNGKCSTCGEQLITYNTNGTYLANWGTRDETATFLTPYASAFYTGNYTYEALSKLSGGSSQANASSSALYNALQTLMKDKHTYKNAYSANNTLLKYTDCVGNDISTISSFYSGKSLIGDWDNRGGTWNKEHTWPNSKGLDGSDEDDVMMIRPTATSENTSRGNTAYGEGSSYYDPNGEGQNVRGDCARIVLYVYVRWGNTQYMWGTSGVMESVDILLKWMAEDPVDTWELARNDVVESITGTRNVFVDYPELAWQLFGKSIPTGVATPSSAAACSGGNSGGGSSTSSVASMQIYFPNLQDDGDCALIKVGNTEVLVDAGATRGSAATVVPYIKQYCTDGVLEYVIATHAHEDHIAAFVGSKGTDGVFNNFVCETIIDFPNANSSSTIYTDYKTWRDKEVAAGAVHYTALDCWNNANGASRSYELGVGVTMHILYQKYYEEKASGENNHSVCMMISQGDNHYLFTGDLESAGEASLVASNDLPKMAFYKAGHHGSSTSSSATLIDVIQPQVVVATCVAGGESYDFPKQSFINNVAKYTDKVYIPSYYTTSGILDLNGNICVSSADGKTLQVACSNNNTLLRDTAWFKSNRTTPSNWAA